MTERAVVIPFPLHRVRRPARIGKVVFAPLRDVAALDSAHARLVWSCTAAATLLSVALQIALVVLG